MLIYATALAVRPVAKLQKGKLEDRAHPADIVGALAEFDGSRAEAMAAVRDAAAEAGLQPDAIIVGLLASKAKLVACYPDGPHRMKSWLSFAQALSKNEKVARAWAFIHPGTRYDKDADELEQEGYWQFEAGKQTGAAQLKYRDDPTYVEWVRARVANDAMDRERRAHWPLSQLAQSASLPGRSFFAIDRGLISLAENPWPKDAGDELVLVSVFLPDDVRIELRQMAESQKTSTSALMQEALLQAKKKGLMGSATTVAPPRTAAREVLIYLSAETFWLLNEWTTTFSVTNDAAVVSAWRSAHPSARK